ncbi:hypothetical protein AKJ64_03450 [candidate division MSBL1 archaeon SCGC-AAA259E17]|uniref:Topo IA-type catalytic domain-containing protein n=1 Tax=candidate division MSBL1 archaeon SCGC-AAA259E17 TaxID=1698263 RepID=A0A133UDN2_9EURY|nr:hypothetical protein AKJ64_03450 [candidate division MSBL1 archaeon SCGC-AAA259E17]
MPSHQLLFHSHKIKNKFKNTKNQNLEHEGEAYEPGETVELPEKAARQAIEKGAAKNAEEEDTPKNSIIKEMERRKIGTKATRAPTVEKLKDRGYIQGKRKIKGTELGLAVAKSLETHAPELASEKMTRKFENKMEKIRNGEKNHTKIINEARNELKDISREFKRNENKIGKTLVKAKREAKEKKKEKTLGDSPECGEGKIVIKKSSNGKKFAGCDQYPDCKNSYATPQRHFKILKSRCDNCGLQLLSLKGKHGRFHLCPNCGPTD